MQKAADLVNKSAEVLARNFTTITVEEGFSVIKIIDEALIASLPKADAAIDATHLKFLDALKSLKMTTKKKVEFVYSHVPQSVEEAKACSGSMLCETYKLAEEKAPALVKTIETLITNASEVIEVTKHKAADSYLAAEKYAQGTYDAANEQIAFGKQATLDAATSKYAQAKVVTVEIGARAMEVSKPYVLRAVEISTPIITPLVVKATPYVSPYVEYAKKTFEGNPTVGPYFEAAIAKSSSCLAEAKAFYLETSAESAVDDLVRE